MSTDNPLDRLKGFQRAVHADKSRFKAWLKARQIGGSFTSAAEPVEDCLRRQFKKEKKVDWITLSAGERQALEWLEKAKQWTEAFQLKVEDIREDRDSSQALLKQGVIQFAGGCRIIALPANPATARGYSGNMIFDEFAFHENPDAIWRACYPIITNPLKGELKLRVLSTPNGQGNKFHDVCTKMSIAEGGRFSVHKTDIYQAAKELAPNNPDAWVAELRDGMADPDGWAQEFECDFIDAGGVLLPYEVIALAENPLATLGVTPDFWIVKPPGAGQIVAGYDFARSRDLSVLWTSENIGGVYEMTREVLTMEKMSTPDQFRHVAERMNRIDRLCVDYTGPGVGIGDLLVEKFGEYAPEKHRHGKVELCTFTAKLKNEMFPHLRQAFDNRRIGIPQDRAVREDLHSIYRVAMKGGGVTYRAPHTADGHADRATALALCHRAAMQLGAGSPAECYVVTA